MRLPVCRDDWEHIATRVLFHIATRLYGLIDTSHHLASATHFSLDARAWQGWERAFAMKNPYVPPCGCRWGNCFRVGRYGDRLEFSKYVPLDIANTPLSQSRERHHMASEEDSAQDATERRFLGGALPSSSFHTPEDWYRTGNLICIWFDWRSLLDIPGGTLDNATKLFETNR